MSKVGINLAAVNYWGSQYPFIDRMKSAGWWTAVDDKKNSTSFTDLDSNGYPGKLPSGTAYVYTSIALDPVELSMTDRYVLTYEGTAKLVPTGARIISATDGRIVFEATKQQIQLKVSDISASDPLSDISIVREDQVELFRKGVVFNPDFVSKIDPFSTLRFMDWGATNESGLTSWADRPHVSDRSWAGSEGGVPIEIMVDLANQTRNNMWINIPAGADDTYVRKTLEYVKANLDPALKAKVEYSNEMWNFTFDQANYALVKGNELFGKDVNGDGRIDANDPREHVADGYLQFYGYRAAQVAAIAKSVFGAQADARLENVLAPHGPNNVASIVSGVEKAGMGSVAKLFDDYAVATYFGYLGNGTAADFKTLMGWARGGKAGIDAAIQEIAHGGTLSKTISLDDIKASLARQGDAAISLGLDLVAYEGGLDVTAYRAPAADQADLIDFYNRLLADPRIGTFYRQMQSAFEAAGGVELNAFNDSGSSTNKYGQWGALSTIYDKGSVRYDALVSLAKEGKAGIGKLVKKTLDASYTLSPVQTDMIYTGVALNTITGNALNNRLVAGDGGGKLYGMAGDDTLVGGAGADHLDGGIGADNLIGGAGNDTYIVDNVGDKVTEYAGGGTDEVRASLSQYRLTANVENLTYAGSDDFRGAGNEMDNIIRGGNGKNTLDGGLGNDTLYGGDSDDTFADAGGADRMIGGRGNDIYYVDNAGDRIVELADQGNDTVYSSISFSLAGQALEVLRTRGNDAINLTGNELDNTIIGNDAVNILRGGAGDDSLKGMGGNDTLYGDAGDDVLDGGAGNDILHGGAGDDRLTGGVGDDMLIGGPGADRLTGGAGADTFRFESLSDLALTRTASDIIFDFEAGDRIDLGMIDAIRGTAANDAFRFIGSAAFSKTAGELRVSSYGGRWDIAGDVNGDGVADFILTANKAAAFQASDFIL